MLVKLTLDVIVEVPDDFVPSQHGAAERVAQDIFRNLRTHPVNKDTKVESVKLTGFYKNIYV